MRPVMFALLCAVLACHDSNTRVDDATVQWMEWPAEVNAGQAFRTRLVVWSVCAVDPQFRAGVHADLSAVTFAPYYLVGGGPIYCVAEGTTSLVAAIALDTAGTVPGLHSIIARTYEMRGTSPTAFRSLNVPAPIITYGTVTVRPSGADASRHNAGGYASAERDTLGCMRIRPQGLYRPNAALVLDDQADTVSFSYAFVRGYIYDAPAAVCGETRVFHLLSRS